MALLKRQSDKVDVLAGVPLFADLSKKELTALARLADEVDVKEGTVLAREGETAHQAVVVLKGSAVVHRRGRKVADVGEGGIVGETGLVSDQPRNATVKAAEDSTVLVLEGRAFSQVMSDMPSVALKVLRVVAARLAEADRTH